MELPNIKEQELEFCESFCTPRCLLETLFPNFDNLAEWSPEKFGDVRKYQLPFISDESIIDFEATAEYHGLNPKEAFQLRKNVGDIFCMGARKFGKTLLVEKLDLVRDMICSLFSNVKKVAFSSVDLIHIREVLDDVKACFQNHPICKLWERRITGAPDYKFQLKTGYSLNSVNFNVGSKNPGRQWYGKHVNRVYIEEASLETDEVYKKRKDALSEFGAVFRISGMTDFTPYSPAGKTFYALENKNHVINLPQYVNPYWDAKEKKDRIEHYGGEDSIGYRVFVEGEVVSDGINTFDMDRVRKACYRADKKGISLEQIKRFEISKERFGLFRNLIVLDRPSNADRIFVSSDIGEKVTEIIIHAEIGKKYKYLYNIVLYNLTHLEQWEVFQFVCRELKFNVLSLDCGDGMGRAIYREAEEIYPKDNLVWYDGSSKIDVDFEKDEQGNIVIEKGKPLVRQEYMSEWSVKRLQDMLYNGRCIIPEDFKFDSQFSVVVSMITGNRTKYKCVSQSGDHLFDAWRVFAIALWLKQDFNLTKPVQSDWGNSVGAVSWKKGDKK